MFVHVMACELIKARNKGIITLFGNIARFPNKVSILGYHFWKVVKVFVHIYTCYDTTKNSCLIWHE